MLVRRWLQEPCVRVLRVGRVSIQILSISVYWHSSDSARQDNPRRDGNFVVVTATRQGRLSRDMCTPNCTCAMCRPLHAIIDNLSGITPNRFLVESCINDEKAMHAQATCRLLNDLLHHYSISEDCWDNAPKISPSVTSLGSVGILRLHDASLGPGVRTCHGSTLLLTPLWLRAKANIHQCVL